MFLNGPSTSFQAQAAHFRFSPDSGHIATSHRSATNWLTRDEARRLAVPRPLKGHPWASAARMRVQVQVRPATLPETPLYTAI